MVFCTVLFLHTAESFQKEGPFFVASPLLGKSGVEGAAAASPFELDEFIRDAHEGAAFHHRRPPTVAFTATTRAPTASHRHHRPHHHRSHHRTRHRLLTPVQALRSTRRAPGLAIALHSRGFLTAAAYRLAQKQMPKMSETEKVALGCGTVGSELHA